MTRPTPRRALALFLPVALVATMGCGLAYLTGQQLLRAGANDPQLQVAEDAAAALDAGSTPAGVVAGSAVPVDVATSLAPFLVVLDPKDTVLATDGRLAGGDPVPPAGVLAHAREAAPAPNVVTWQPRDGVRIASVTVAWRGGTVLAGRSLREVERREDVLLSLVAAAWLVMLVVLAAAAAGAAALWPSVDGPAPRS